MPKFHPALLTLLVFPIAMVAMAGRSIIGFESVDLEGHLWTVWNAMHGPMTRTEWVNAPVGVDLMPVVGGWLDIRLGSWLAPALGLARAYNTVLALYSLLAGLGGVLLVRALGGRVGTGVVAGILLQLDPFILLHLSGGRPEQAALGLVALALAGAIGAWRTDDPRWILIAGIAGALVIFASWELAILLAVGMVGVLWVLSRGLAAQPGVARRWTAAALTTAVLAGPWAAVFLSRTLSVRAASRDPIGLEIAQHASIGWMQFWTATGGNPGLIPTLILLALPILDRPRRRLWGAVWVVLALTFVLGLGPFPAAWPGDPPTGLPAPYTWLQEFPVLRWFHWPDRIVSAWGVVGAGATGFALSRLWDEGRTRLAMALGVLAVGLAVVRVHSTARWPIARFELPESAVWDALAADPSPGAVFDLPVRMRGISSYGPALAQMHHGRPVRSYGGVPWLLPPPEEQLHLPQFAIRLDPRHPVPAAVDVTPTDLETLRSQGFGFIVLQRPKGSRAWFETATRRLSEDLGAPAYTDDSVGWAVWRIAAP